MWTKAGVYDEMALKKCMQCNNTSGFEVFRDWSDFHMKGLSYQVCQKVWWCIDDVVEEVRKTSWKTVQRSHNHPSRIVFPVKICCRKHKGSHRIASGIENMSSTLHQALLHGIPVAHNGLCPSSAIHFNEMSILAYRYMQCSNASSKTLIPSNETSIAGLTRFCILISTC